MFDLIAELIRHGFAVAPEATFAGLVAALAALSAIAAKFI